MVHLQMQFRVGYLNYEKRSGNKAVILVTAEGGIFNCYMFISDVKTL